MAARPFISGYNPTVGVAFVRIPCAVNSEALDLAVAEAGGGEQLTTLTQPFFSDADAVCLCFDLSNRRSFERLSEWQGIVGNHCRQGVPLFLVGCRCDLDSAVPDDAIERLCQAGAMEYWATSAKTALRVADLVMRVCVVGVAAKLFRGQAEPEPETVDILHSPYASEWLDFLTDSSG
jgi:GTPase SAR1 family protein